MLERSLLWCRILYWTSVEVQSVTEGEEIWNWNLLRVRAITRLLFVKDTVRSLMSTNAPCANWQVIRCNVRPPDGTPTLMPHPLCETPGWQFVAGFKPKLDSSEASAHTSRLFCQPAITSSQFVEIVQIFCLGILQHHKQTISYPGTVFYSLVEVPQFQVACRAIRVQYVILVVQSDS